MVDRAEITQTMNEEAYRGANHETYTVRGVNTRDLQPSVGYSTRLKPSVGLYTRILPAVGLYTRIHTCCGVKTQEFKMKLIRTDIFPKRGIKINLYFKISSTRLYTFIVFACLSVKCWERGRQFDTRCHESTRNCNLGTDSAWVLLKVNVQEWVFLNDYIFLEALYYDLSFILCFQYEFLLSIDFHICFDLRF
jgi:hypothetical protein